LAPRRTSCRAAVGTTSVSSLVSTGSSADTCIMGDDEADTDLELDALFAALMDPYTTLDVIRPMVERNPRLVRTRGSDGFYLPLHAALITARPEVVRYLLGKWTGAVRETILHTRELPVHRVFFNCHLRTERRAEGQPSTMLGIVQSLVEPWQESLQQADEEGRLALHHAVDGGFVSAVTPVDVVRYLVNTFPQAVRTMDQDGCLPLHLACTARSDTPHHDVRQAVQLLVEQYPESVRVRRPDGRIALHDAARSGDLAMCQILVRQWPGSAFARNREGWIPLHAAASSGNLVIARYLVEQWRESVHQTTDAGWLPIHLAVQHRPTLDREIDETLQLVRFLYEQFPRSAWARTSEGYLPLHVAAGLGRGVGSHGIDKVERMEFELVSFLHEREPLLVYMPSRDGLLPLHFAIRGGHSLRAVQLLVQPWSESIHFSNAEGFSALHVALTRGTPFSVELVRWLVGAYPVLLRGVDKTASLPLHVAAANKQPLEVIRLLVEPLPRAIGHRDATLALPLHVALSQQETPLEVVRYLVERRPNSLSQANGKGLLPLHVAAVSDAPLEVIFYLATKRPESTQLRSRPR
jgi:ankyrin repeat protein